MYFGYVNFTPLSDQLLNATWLQGETANRINDSLVLGVLGEMLETAEYVLSDVDLVATFAFRMRKLKWLHLTSPGN